MSSHFLGKSYIYQFHVKHNGMTLHGAAALNKILATEEGRQGLRDMDRIVDLITNFQTSYEEELNRFINIIEETGEEPYYTINYDNIGVGEDRRDGLRRIIHGDPDTEAFIHHVISTLPNGDAKIIKENLSCIKEKFNFQLDGENRNKHLVEVW